MIQLGVRGKLVLLTLAILVVVSFGFTLLQLRLLRSWVEEDLQERAVIFAREVAASIGDRREFEPGPLIDRKVQQILGVRRSVLQLDILGFNGKAPSVIATSGPGGRLRVTPRDIVQLRQGRVVSRLVTAEDGRHWEVMAPVVFDDVVAGAIAAKFSLNRSDAREARIRMWDLLLTAASVLMMGLLMSLAVHVIVNRPIRRFMDAVQRVQRGNLAPVAVAPASDEFGILARHFNDMMDRIRDFNHELEVKVKEATAELEGRYQEVQRLHEALFAMQRTLSHAERLALAGRVMAEVAHEVGTPLHSMAGHVELLRRELPADAVPESVSRRLTVIDSQLARVTEIIAKLLDLTRRAPGHPVAVDLDRLVRDTVELVRPAMTAGSLTLDVEVQAGLPSVRGHADQLQQVVLNLLTNAMDATAAGGTIHVVTRTGADGGIQMEVADTGHGIPSAQQEQIFEPFFSTKAPGRGTGLGLFISAQIVREHDGRIEVQSAEGKGTTFRVILPAATAA